MVIWNRLVLSINYIYCRSIFKKQLWFSLETSDTLHCLLSFVVMGLEFSKDCLNLKYFFHERIILELAELPYHIAHSILKCRVLSQGLGQRIVTSLSFQILFHLEKFFKGFKHCLHLIYCILVDFINFLNLMVLTPANGLICVFVILGTTITEAELVNFAKHIDFNSVQRTYLDLRRYKAFDWWENCMLNRIDVHI